MSGIATVGFSKRFGSDAALRGVSLDAAPGGFAAPLPWVVHPREQDGLRCERLCGALSHRLRTDRAETELPTLDGKETPRLDDVRARIDPPGPERAADSRSARDRP